MSFINSAMTNLGSMFQMPQRQQQTMLSSSPDKGTRDPSPVTALRQPLSPDNIAAIAVTDVASISSGYWDQHCQVMGDIYTRMASFFVADATLSDAVQSTPVSRTGSGGLSHLGRLGLLLGFFATASAAGLRGISGESSHSYSTSTRAIDGTNDWFRIAHIIEGNSSAARFNLNGHYGDNEWGMAIELHAGIMSLSSEWHSVSPEHVPQGFRFATGPNIEGVYLEVQGTANTGQQILSCHAKGHGFRTLDFVSATYSVAVTTYDFATVGSLLGGRFADQPVGGAGHVMMLGGASVLAVRNSRVGVGTVMSDTKLHIKDDVSFSTTERTGTLFLEGKSEAASLGAYGGSLIFSRSLGMRRAAAIAAQQDLADGDVAALVFFTKTDTGSNDILAERARVSSGGNFGIGTDNPESRLSVVGSKDTTVLRLIAPLSTVSGTAFQNYAELLFQNSAGVNANAGIRHYANLWNGNGGELAFFTTSTAGVYGERFRLTNGGDVGIGVLSPQSKLDVQSSNKIVFSGFSATETALRTYSNFAGFQITAYQSVSGSPYTKIMDIVANADSGSKSEMRFLTTATGGVPLERMRINSAGNVGIGTTPTIYMLDVASSGPDAIRAMNILSGVSVGILPGSTRGAIGTLSNSDFYLFTNSIEKMAITAAGYVGIGTSSPSALLHLRSGTATTASNTANLILHERVNADASAIVAILAKGSSDRNAGRIVFGRNSAADWGADLSFVNGFLAFETVSANVNIERMRISSDGNVGIGTASPGALLEVNGDVKVNGNIDVDGNAKIGRIGNTYEGYAVPYNSATGDYEIHTTFPTARVLLYTGSGGSHVERLRVTSLGQLLIGMSSARVVTGVTARIQNEGTTTDTSSMSFVRNSDNGGSPALLFGKTRGTSVGDTTIVQSGDSLGEFYFAGSDGASLVRAAMIFAAIDGTPGTNDMPGRLVFSTTADGNANPTERLRIDSVGNVGIGTTSPLTRLDTRGDVFFGKGTGGISGDGAEMFFGVSGTTLSYAMASIKGYNTFTSGGFTQGKLIFSTRGSDNVLTQRMLISESGFLGVGTTTPLSKLHVAGDIMAGDVSSSVSGATILRSRELTDEYRAVFGVLRSSGASFWSQNLIADPVNAQSFLGGRVGTVGGGAWIIDVDGASRFVSAASQTMTVGGAVTLQERFRIASNGNVGIGTNVPATLLSLFTSSKNPTSTTSLTSEYVMSLHRAFGADGDQVGIAFSIYTDGVTPQNTVPGAAITHERLSGNSAGHLIFKTRSSVAAPGSIEERMRITSTGAVTIGTTSTVTIRDGAGASLSSKLLVASDVNAVSAVVAVLDGVKNHRIGLFVDAANNVLGLSTTYSSVPPDFVIRDDAGERFRIGSNGRVGIGTTAPDGKLEVKSAQNNVLTGTFATPHLKLSLSSQVNTNGFTGITYGTSVLDNYGFSVGARRIGTEGTHAAFDFLFHANDPVGVALMRITAAGNVGIGTTSPGSKLTLAEYVSSTASPNYATQFNIHNSHDGGSRILFSNSAASELCAILAGVEGTGSGTDDGALSFHTALNGVMSEKMRITADNKVLLGTTTSRTIASVGPMLGVESTSSTRRSIAIAHNDNSVLAPVIGLSKSRSTSVNGVTTVQSGDHLGTIVFSGADGTNTIEAAYIGAAVDGTPGTNDMPGRLVFSTTADGAATPTERMRINNAGKVLFGTSVARVLGTGVMPRLQLEGTDSHGASFGMIRNTATGGGPYFTLGKSRSGSLAGVDVVQSSDELGTLRFEGADGTGLIGAAEIVAAVDGTPGTNDMPGRLVFRTTADGDATPTERMRITNDGKLLMGTTAARLIDASVMGGGGNTPRFLIEGNALTTYSTFTNRNDGHGSIFSFGKTRGTTSGALTAVLNGDYLGALTFNGADGVSMINAASILAAVDGTPGTNDMPGRLIFSTTADGDATPTERMRITSAGNVGIGTASPLTLLHIEYPSYIDKDTVQGLLRLTGQSNNENTGDTLSAGAALEFYNRWGGGAEYAVARISGRASQTFDGGLQFDVAQNTGAGQSNFQTAMTILDTGNVGIGTTSPTAKLSVNGVIQGTSDFSADISSDTSAKFGTTDRAYMQINRLGTASGGYLGFYTSVTSVGTVAERMRIIESGNVGIGTTTPAAALHIGGTGTLRIPGAVGGTGTPAIIDANGDIRPQTSSRKFKHDIVDLDFDARTLAAFRAVRYVLNSDNSADFGFIAEELSGIFPLAVNFDKDGNPYSVKYGQITVLLTKGWQYHEQRLAEQSEINFKQAETIDSQARALASHEETIAEMKSSMAFFQKENEVLKKDALRSREVIDRLSRENDAMNERLAKLEAMVGKLV